MAKRKKENHGQGKSRRSAVVSVRLDPKLRYLAELASRKQRRTLSSFIEWAVEDSLDRVNFVPGVSVASMAENLWDVDEPDRFTNLAFEYEYLLTHDEEILWKLIKENGYLWKGRFNESGEWDWKASRGTLIYARLREYWSAFTAVALGKKPQTALPGWKKTGSPEAKSLKRNNIAE